MSRTRAGCLRAIGAYAPVEIIYRKWPWMGNKPKTAEYYAMRPGRNNAIWGKMISRVRWHRSAMKKGMTPL